MQESPGLLAHRQTVTPADVFDYAGGGERRSSWDVEEASPQLRRLLKKLVG